MLEAGRGVSDGDGGTSWYIDWIVDWLRAGLIVCSC